MVGHFYPLKKCLPLSEYLKSEKVQTIPQSTCYLKSWSQVDKQAWLTDRWVLVNVFLPDLF